MNTLPVVKLKPSVHNEKEVIQVLFDRNDEVQQLLRSAIQMRWSKTMNCWHVPFSKTITQDLFQLLKNKAFLDYSDVKASLVPEVSIPIKPQIRPVHELNATPVESRKKIEEFKHWMHSKRYSESTIGTYVDSLTIFLRYYSSKPIAEITNQDIILFNNYYILANKFSASYQNQVVNAIKLFFSKIENKKLNPELIHRPKRTKLLPNVLSKEEIKRILNAQSNIKHKTMLSLVYSCGLRRSELLNLRLTDVDSNRNLIIVKQAKGRKDRIVPLSQKTLVLIREYFEACKPKEWLFEGQDKTSKYDESSLALVLKQAVEKCKINKPVTLHWLRHSYATHLLENGTDLRYIQEILGHSRSTTTEIYTHVSTKGIQNVVSPFDSL
jgi:integrase/recombinase XerD